MNININNPYHDNNNPATVLSAKAAPDETHIPSAAKQSASDTPLISGNAQNSPVPLAQVLLEAGLTDNRLNRQVALALIDNSMSLSGANLHLIRSAALAYPDASPYMLALMSNSGIPINSHSVEMMQNFSAGKLLFSEELPGLIDEIVLNAGTNTELDGSILKLINSSPEINTAHSEMSEASMSANNNINSGVSEQQITQPQASDYVFHRESPSSGMLSEQTRLSAEQSDAQQSQPRQPVEMSEVQITQTQLTADKSEVQTSQIQRPTESSETQNSQMPLTDGQTGAQTAQIQLSTGKSGAQTLQTLPPAEMSEAQFRAIPSQTLPTYETSGAQTLQTMPLNDNSEAQLVAASSQTLPTTEASETRTIHTQPLSDNAEAQLEATSSQTLPSAGQSESATSQIAFSKPYTAQDLINAKENGTLTSILKKALSVPADRLNRETLRDFNERILKFVSELKEKSTQDESTAALSEKAAKAEKALDNMADINRAFVHAYIPLRLDEKYTDAGIYVYTDGRKRAPDPENCSCLLHLDMQNLGPTDIFLKMNKNRLHTDFAADTVSNALLSKYFSELSGALENLGFTVTANFKDTLQKDTDSVLFENGIPSAETDTITNFDIKA